MPIDPRIKRLERDAERGDWGAQVALEQELIRLGRPPRSNAARDAALHESKSAGVYYAAMLLDALRAAQADGWWNQTTPSTRERRALMVQPNDLVIERENRPSIQDRNQITLRLPDGLGHPRLLFHEHGPRSKYLDESTGEWVPYGPSLPATCTSRFTGTCVGHVYGGISLSVSSSYKRDRTISGVVKLEWGLTGPYFLAQHVRLKNSIRLRANWKDARFLHHAARLYCEAWEHTRRLEPSYTVLKRMEELRDKWSSRAKNDRERRELRQAGYEVMIEAGSIRGLPQLPYEQDRLGLLTPEGGAAWHRLFDDLDQPGVLGDSPL